MKSEKRKENYFRILKYQCINTLVFLCLILLIFFIYTTPIYASSITLSSSQTTLSVNDEFVVDAQLSINASDGTIYYLRGEFYLTDGQYCGYTWNGNSWFNGSISGDGYKNLQQISITSDAWAGQLKAKIDSSDSSCVNSGNYFFKIQRYTNTGNSSTDTMIPLTISVVIPTPSPSPTPTPTNSPTTSPTQAPTASPTKSPTPISTPVKTASPKPVTPKPTPTESGQTEESLVLEPQVLSLSTVASSAEPKTTGKNLPAGRQDKSPILAILLVFSGVCFLGYGGYMLYNQTYENKTNTD